MASPNGEVITLQFGNYANWAGSHFWNFQDEAQGLAEGNEAIAKAYAEVDSRVLYRVGETHEGAPTYTPRMVFFDLCGSMGGVSKAGYLYGAGNPDNLPPITTWDGKHKVYRTELAPKSSFLCNLEGGGGDDDEDEEGYEEEEADPDVRMRDEDDYIDESDEEGGRGRGRKKWGGGGAGHMDAINALRAKLAGQLLHSPKRAKLAADAAANTPARTEEEKKKKRAAEEEAAAAALEASAERLEDEATYWTDYMKAYLHPKSTYLLQGLWQGVDHFAGFGEGTEYIRIEDRREDMRDRVRFWAEECDTLRGFQLSADDLSGFGGLAAACVEELKDEYASTPISIFSLRPPQRGGGGSSGGGGSGKGGGEGGKGKGAAGGGDDEADGDINAKLQSRMGLLNDALACALLAPNADLYTPISGAGTAGRKGKKGASPSVLAGLNPNRWYHTSALAAACMDTSTLPWRVTGSAGAVGDAEMRSVARHLSARAGGPFAAMCASLPVPAIPDPYEAAKEADDIKRRRAEGERSGSGSRAGGSNLRYSREVEDIQAAEAERARAVLSGMSHFTPGCGDGTAEDAAENEMEPLAEMYSLRGTRQLVGAAASGLSTAGRSTVAASPSDALSALDAALRHSLYRAPRHRFSATAPLPLPLPFPRLFHPRPTAPSTPHPTNAPMMTRLTSTSSYGAVLGRISAGWQRASKASAGRAALKSWGYADDDVDEIGETIINMSHNYGGDSDADDFSDVDDVEEM